MKTYYHATNCLLKAGDTKSINDYDGDYNKGFLNMCPRKREITILLDNQKPKEIALSRTKAIYLFDNLSFCKKFAKEEKYRYVYEVIPKEPFYGPFPMAMVDRLYKSAKECIELIKEYWCPTREWNIYEYLASEISIIKDTTNEGAIAFLGGYPDDIELSEYLCNKKRIRKDSDET